MHRRRFEPLSELQSQFGDQIRDAAEAAYAVVGKQINLGSAKQLQVVLFDELGMPKTKRTKTGCQASGSASETSTTGKEGGRWRCAKAARAAGTLRN